MLILTQQKLKIEKELKEFPEAGITGYPMISKFIITDEHGFKYVFEDAEITHNHSMASAAAVYTSSWYLSKIISPAGKDFILFKYENIDLTYNIGRTESSSIPAFGEFNIPGRPSNITISSQRIQGKRIQHIYFPDGVTMSFNYSTTERTEFPYGDFLCKKIVISHGNKQRGFKLVHDNSLNRPTLKKVIPFSGTAETEDKGYSFEYNDPLPARLSFMQDHWGFYNDNQGSLIPDEIVSLGSGHDFYGQKYGTYHQLGGGNRSTDPTRVKAGSLKRIHYPTGGYTEFEMEANQAVDPRLDQQIQYSEQLFRRNDAISISCNSQSSTVSNFLFQGDPHSVTEFTVKISSSTYSCISNCKVVLEIRNASGLLIDMRYFDPPNSSYQPEEKFTIGHLTRGET